MSSSPGTTKKKKKNRNLYFVLYILSPTGVEWGNGCGTILGFLTWTKSKCFFGWAIKELTCYWLEWVYRSTDPKRLKSLQSYSIIPLRQTPVEKAMHTHAWVWNKTNIFQLHILVELKAYIRTFVRIFNTWNNLKDNFLSDFN
jgi:hypothetical protein